MRHGSLFSGIGGFDLAAQWMGWENVFHCEIEEFPRKVLKYHFPKSISHEDIKQTNFKEYNGTIDIVSGGFPCQPFSLAGQRKGSNDSRHLWPEMLRAIREIAPAYVVGENVYGLFNWSKGLVFESVCVDLENEGYEIQPFIIPACGVDAPHKRERIWFIATNPNFKRRQTPNTQEFQLGKSVETQSFSGKGIESLHSRKGWQSFPSQSPICGRNDGVSLQLDNITFPKWRNESLKAYGNAIVPQVAFQIFQAIQQTHSHEKNNSSLLSNES